MNILYLHTDVASDRDVPEVLGKMDCGLACMEAPRDGEGEEGYAERLLHAIEESRAELVFSLKYFPIVSIACEAVAVKYAAWIVSDYDPGVYSCTLLNPCNYVFMADYALYREFQGGGFPHLFFLPMGAYVEWVDRVAAGAGREYQADLLLPCEIQPRESLGMHPLSPGSPLKDATKGYLEGCIACQHQLSGLHSMAESLPPYVWEDLAAHFAGIFCRAVGADSVETPTHYYDSCFFNPLITFADREIHLGAVAKNPHFRQVWQDNSWDREEMLRRAVGSRINLVIAHRNWRSAVPQIAWDIMAAGGFLLGSWQEDYLRLFPDHPPILYGEEVDMLGKAIYYLHHEQEREKLAGELAQEVRAKHTCRGRLEELLGKIG